MKIHYTIILSTCFFISALAQETTKLVKTTPSIPQFESCEQDDQTGKPCLENTFKTLFKEFYKETEIAKDYEYSREVTGNYIVDRRGKIIQKKYNTVESPIFVAIQRAIDKFSRLTPSTKENDLAVEYPFQVIYTLKRSNPYAKKALSIELEFVYPEGDNENS